MIKVESENTVKRSKKRRDSYLDLTDILTRFIIKKKTNNLTAILNFHCPLSSAIFCMQRTVQYRYSTGMRNSRKGCMECKWIVMIGTFALCFFWFSYFKSNTKSVEKDWMLLYIYYYEGNASNTSFNTFILFQCRFIWSFLRQIHLARPYNSVLIITFHE